MTALERQLTKALRELAAQSARERTHHAEQIEASRQQVETLRRQVVQLAGQLTRLTADYRALAATLRGRWN